MFSSSYTMSPLDVDILHRKKILTFPTLTIRLIILATSIKSSLRIFHSQGINPKPIQKGPKLQHHMFTFSRYAA